MLQCYSLSFLYPLLTPLFPKTILCVCLYFCPTNRFISTIFSRFYIYALIYNICFSVSDLFHSVYQALVSSTSLALTHMHSFLWLSNIPVYVCTTTYLSICQWASRLFPYPNHCKQCCNEHWVPVSFSIMVFSGYVPSSGRDISPEKTYIWLTNTWKDVQYHS